MIGINSKLEWDVIIKYNYVLMC